MRVYIGGTFDRFHAGHLELITAARKLADCTFRRGLVVVALNTDEFVQEYKGRPPVQPYDERFAMLSAIRQVDVVKANSGGADSKPSIAGTETDIILAGADWATPDGQKYRDQLGVTVPWLVEKGITILFLPRVGGYASSNDRIATGINAGFDAMDALTRRSKTALVRPAPKDENGSGW